MGIEERFVDPNTQEAPLPEYNKIISPYKNPYHETYDDRYFKETGNSITQKRFGCLLVVGKEFDGFDDPYDAQSQDDNQNDQIFQYNRQGVLYDFFPFIDNRYISVQKNIDDTLKTKVNNAIYNLEFKIYPEPPEEVGWDYQEIRQQIWEFWDSKIDTDDDPNSPLNILKITTPLVCKNAINNDPAKLTNLVRESVENYAKKCSSTQKITFFIQDCIAEGIPYSGADFKRTYEAKDYEVAINEILEFYDIQIEQINNYNHENDTRIFKEIEDFDYFEHDVFVPYVEDAFRLYTRIGQAFYDNGKPQYSYYSDPEWKGSKEPSTATIDGCSYLQIKVFDLGLFPDQCNAIYRAAYYDYQEYLPKWCTPLYSMAFKKIARTHKEAVLVPKIKYVDAVSKELVQVGEHQEKHNEWTEGLKITDEKPISSGYSSNHKQILTFIPEEDYTGPFSITMGTGHWYGWYIKEFNIDDKGNSIDNGTIIDGSAQFYYRGSYNGNNGQVTDNRQEVSQQSNGLGDLNTIRSNYVSYNGILYDSNNYNNNLSYGTTYAYQTVLQRYNFNLKVYNFIKQFENNHEGLNSSSLHDDLFVIWKNELLNKKQELLTDSRRGTDNEWAVKRETAINNSWLKEIQEYIDDIETNESEYETYEDIVNWYLEKLIDEKYQLESVPYNSKLNEYCIKYDLEYVPVENPDALSGGILVAPVNPVDSNPKDNMWREYATHNNDASLQINSFGNITFKANKKYIIYTRECPGGGTDSSKFRYSFTLNNDPDFSIRIKKYGTRDITVPDYEIQDIIYKKPVEYMEEEIQDVNTYKTVEVVDHMYLQYYNEDNRAGMLIEIGDRMRELASLVVENMEERIHLNVKNYYSRVSEDYITYSERSIRQNIMITRILHDYVIANSHYGESEYCKSFYAALSSGKYAADSEGLALTYKFLCNKFSIPTQIMTGYNFIDITNGQELPSGVFHAWNRSYIGNSVIEQTDRYGCVMLLCGGVESYYNPYPGTHTVLWCYLGHGNKSPKLKDLEAMESDIKLKVKGMPKKFKTFAIIIQDPKYCVDQNYDTPGWYPARNKDFIYHKEYQRSQYKKAYNDLKSFYNIIERGNVNGGDIGEDCYRYYRKYGINHTGEVNCAKILFNAIEHYDPKHKENYTISGSWTDYTNLMYSKRWDPKLKDENYPLDKYYDQYLPNGAFYNSHVQFDKSFWVETDVTLDHCEYYLDAANAALENHQIGEFKGRTTFLNVSSEAIIAKDQAGYRILNKYFYTNYGTECYANFLGQNNHYDELCSTSNQTIKDNINKYQTKDNNGKVWMPKIKFDPENYVWVPRPIS